MSKVLIIGGGVIGLSVAYHLSRSDSDTSNEVLLLERNQLTSGTSWHAAGIVGPLRATPNMTQLASYALTLFPQLENESGMSTGYKRTGGYWLARRPERLDELHRIASLGQTLGLTPQMIDVANVQVPQLDLSAHAGALEVPQDGNVNPVDLCMAYASAARNNGVDIRENTTVKKLLVDGRRISGVQLADGTRLYADTVVLCAGAWSGALALTAGAALPLQAVEHMYVVTDSIDDLPDPFPVVRDLDTGIYIKGDTGKLVIGGFEPNAKCWNAYGVEGDRAFLQLAEDWQQFEPFMNAALDLLPCLHDTSIRHFMNGPESFTNDSRPLVGETNEVDGLFVAAGMNSVGVMSSAGIGRLLSQWIINGHPTGNVWEVDIARVDPATATPAHMQARMQESVADLFAMHWPYKQAKAGRDMRTSVLHDRWHSAGAVFGSTAGWERGLWYATNENERELPYSVSSQHWQAIAEREAAYMHNGAVMLDLTPFTKLKVSGTDALAELNRLVTAQLDVPIDRVVYTQMLNARGGIEIDLTVTRVGKSEFDIVSGAATRHRDIAMFRRSLSGNVQIDDHTEDYCVIGLMGADSRRILQSICSNWQEVDFSTATNLQIATVSCRATRLSFVGELGWELRVANADATVLFDKLTRCGVQPMGHYALESCRIEKGYRHWGHDIAPDVTPFEAGLAFTIDWHKEFVGKQALLKQKYPEPDNLTKNHTAMTRRLMLLQIEGDALMLHDEPVFENNRYAGLTPSGTKGVRTRLTLAFAMINITAGETLQQSSGRKFQVEVAGRRYNAVPLQRVPFDPDNLRMHA